MPLQVMLFCAVVLAHEVPHAVPFHFSHDPPAAQLPSVPPHMLAGGCCLHTPRGSGVPGVTLPHVPVGLPVSPMTHAWHWLVHAWSQQTPSGEQWPLVHWLFAVHPWPFPSFGVQVPALQ
jgi:hypothetical protein